MNSPRIIAALLVYTAVVGCSDSSDSVKEHHEATGYQLKADTLLITIEDASIKLDGQVVVLDSLKQRLAQEVALLDSSPLLIIQGDKNTTDEQFTQIGRIAGEAGISDLIIGKDGGWLVE